MDEKEKNLNENSENESTPKREVEDTLHTPESAQPVQETPIVEGVTPEGGEICRSDRRCSRGEFYKCIF